MNFLFVGCAVCFGDPTSLSSKAVWVAVISLFGVIAAVLAAIAWTGFSWARRERSLTPEEN